MRDLYPTPAEPQVLTVVVPVQKSDWENRTPELEDYYRVVALEAMDREGHVVSPPTFKGAFEESQVDGLRLHSHYTDPETGNEVYLPERVLLKWECYATPKDKDGS